MDAAAASFGDNGTRVFFKSSYLFPAFFLSSSYSFPSMLLHTLPTLYSSRVFENPPVGDNLMASYRQIPFLLWKLGGKTRTNFLKR